MIVLSGGYITDVDSYEKLINKEGKFSEFLNTYKFHQSESNNEEQVVGKIVSLFIFFFVFFQSFDVDNKNMRI